MLGSVEAGGTKFVCAVAGHDTIIRDQTAFPTTTPGETLGRVVDFFQSAARSGGAVQSVGIGCFGPLDLDRNSAGFGSITTTPKSHWQNINVRDHVAHALGCPVAIDTDVNAAGLAEAAIAGVRSLVYVTVGTGIGAGLIIDGKPLSGLSHPEMGHVRLRRHALDPDYPGMCPFHGDCLEGLASGAAIYQRTGAKLADLPETDVLRKVIADYLAQFCATLALVAAPHIIVLGGGVMAHNADLLPAIRGRLETLMGGYARTPELAAPRLGTGSGIMGGLLLARQALADAGGSA